MQLHSHLFCNFLQSSFKFTSPQMLQVMRLGEFAQQITLSHPCNKKAEFRAQEKHQFSLCQRVAGFLEPGKSSGQEGPGPGKGTPPRPQISSLLFYIILLAPHLVASPTHTLRRTPGLDWGSQWRAKCSLFQSPTISVFSESHSTSLQSQCHLPG